MRLGRFACLLPLVAITACGQTLKPLDQFDAGPGADLSGVQEDGGLLQGDLGSAQVDMTGFNTAGSPVVTITVPAAGTEISGDTLTVTATVTSPTSTLIASGSVQVTITPPGGGVVNQPMQPGAMANTWTADISIAAVPSGMATFTVSAADIAGKLGSAQGTYLHDHGPTITFVKPTAATAKDTLSVEVIIDDALHPITMLSQVKAGIHSPGDITLTQIAGATPFRAAANVNLNNYNPTLDGPQVVTVTATNSKGTSQTARKQFTVDNSGPVIVIDKPAGGSFVGGVTTIQATITDLSGVNPASVVAVVAGNLANTVSLTRMDPMSNDYVGFFDMRALGTNKYVYAEVSVRADDTLGNHNETGEQVIVDNTPPWLSMDGSMQMRVGKYDANNNIECSRLFAPLGPPSDHPAIEGQTVQQVITLRARVEDQGNKAPGLLETHISGLDPSTVTLFAVPFTTGTVLAVDTNGDGICDDVNPTLIPTTNVSMSGEALALAMSPLANGAGSADFRLDAANSPPNTPPAGCAEVGDQATTAPPTPMCAITSGMTFALPTNDAVGAVWSIGPITSTQCAGYQVDSLNHLPEGPTCVITRAVDKAGNQMVSYPLHICIDRNGGKCTSFTPNATDCTGKWDKVNQMLVPGTCTRGTPGTDTFPTSGEVRYLFSIVH